MKEKRGFIMVRNVDLSVWKEFQKIVKAQPGQPSLGPSLTLAMLDYIELLKKR